MGSDNVPAGVASADVRFRVWYGTFIFIAFLSDTVRMHDASVIGTMVYLFFGNIIIP